MNWRGIFGIYAGFAAVLAGAWLWLRLGSVWGLGVIGAGLVLAMASVVQIVRARRGPRPAKPAKVAKAVNRKEAALLEDEAEAIAKSRLAAIAGRTTGRVVSVEPVEAAEVFEPDALIPVVEADGDLSDPVVGEVAETSPEPHGPESVEGPSSDLAALRNAETGFDKLGQTGRHTADVELDEIDATETPPTADPAVVDLPDTRIVALEALPGFPWTARFIGLWTREVTSSCPDELRDAVSHWQRWADTQASGTPIPEEASEEFQAMLAVWRDGGGDVPGLASDDAVAVRLVEEADYDAALAALLPPVLRGAVSEAG